MLVDSHCHLDLLRLDEGVGLEAALDEARHRGVSAFVCIGVELGTFPAVRAIAERHADVFATVGAHPLHMDAPVPEVDELVGLAAHEKVVAIGETGLDYFYDKENHDIQRESFARHIAASRVSGKPLVVHTRGARRDTLDMLRSEGATQGVLHCFTEDWETAREAMDLGFYISFSGIVTFANAVELREVVKSVPVDRMLLETDSPWLAPVPHRGRNNVPAYVVDVARRVAEIKGMSLEDLARVTTGNCRDLFGISV